MSEYHIPAKVLAAAVDVATRRLRDLSSTIRSDEIWNPDVKSALEEAAPLIAAAAYCTGREQAAQHLALRYRELSQDLTTQSTRQVVQQHHRAAAELLGQSTIADRCADIARDYGAEVSGD